MDVKYLMGNDDVLIRSDSGSNKKTYITPKLRTKLLRVAMIRAFDFYTAFFRKAGCPLDYDKLVLQYEIIFSHAVSLGLFEAGGISEKDHLNLWCLGQIYSPEVYLESGVFIGSSLHAFIQSPDLKKVIAIDPNLGVLKIPEDDIPGAKLIGDKDFSQLDINFSGSRSLAYFDDHINTADRIIQASRMGLTHLLFDDSTGLEGVCQRLYPAVPTIPMIVDYELLSAGDELSWSYMREGSNEEATLVSLNIDEAFIDKCQMAKVRIKNFCKIPDLGDYIPQSYPAKTVDTSKFLVELNSDS